MNLLAARFIEWLASVGRTVRTIETYERGVRQLLDWLAGNTTVATIAEVTAQHLQQYQISIYTQGNSEHQRLSVAAQQLRLTIMRQFFSWLVGTQQLSYNPGAGIVLPRVPKQLPTVLKQAEVQLMLNVLPGSHARDYRDRAMLEMLYCTAMRRTELLSLTIYDVDLMSGTVSIKRGKGNSTRVLPLVESAQNKLKEYLEHARGRLLSKASKNLLFVSTRSGGPLAGNDLKRIVEKAAKQAGIKKRVTPHMLRHSLAAHLLQSKADIRHIQKLLGHQKLSTTEIYTQVEVSDLREVFERCHPRR